MHNFRFLYALYMQCHGIPLEKKTMGRFVDGQLQFLSCIPNAMDTKRLLQKSKCI